MAESLPTSISAFAHRRARSDSIASFAYYPDDPEPSPAHENGGFASREDLDDLPFVDELGDDDEEDSADQERRAADNDYVLHRRASTQSRGSVRSRLLRQESST